MTQDHPVPQPDARHKGATTAARCGAMGHHGRCILTQGHDTGIAHLYATPATPVHAEPPVDGLRQRIALAVGAHRNGPASDGLGWFRDETDEHACYALADAVLPLFAAEHAAGRRDGLREGAAALQAVIDRNTPFASRSQSHVALRGAREIVLDLAGQDATPTAPPAEPPAGDTLPEWLNHRYGRTPHGWDALSGDERDYWAHEAAAVPRAVARGGFKTQTGGEQA
jgi:hypothetical protein